MKCPLCGGQLQNQTLTYEKRWGERLYSFREVPALVCQLCGDILLPDEVMRAMERVLVEEKAPEAFETVPVFSLPKLLAKVS